MLTNYHTHVEYCGHAGGTVEEYVKEAIKHNFDIIGISDHAYLPKYVFDRMSLEESSLYYQDLLDAKEKYGDKIKILAGLEIEYMDDLHYYYEELNNKYDYLLLAQHFIKQGDKLISSYSINSPERLELYFQQLIAGMKTGYFSMVAHPDLFGVSYHKFDDDLFVRLSEELIKTSIELNMPLEYNANGYRRELITYKNRQRRQYPFDEFWELVAKHKAPVIIGSDCHDVKLLNDTFVQQAKEDAKKLNLNVIDHI